MANTFDLISLKLNSLKNYQDESLATDVLNKINEYEAFIPQVYGVYQPLKNKYSLSNISDPVKLWVNEENNKKNIEDSYAAGQLLMEKKRGHKVSYQIRWEKDSQARFNYFILSVDIGYLSKEEAFSDFLKLCYELMRLLKPVRGEIVNLSYPGWDAPINLRVRHPELNWMVLFGEPYIDLFGRDKLLKTPCYRVEPIGDKIIALQLTESVFAPIPPEVRKKVKIHLGEKAFVEEGKSSRAYKEGIVPNFDFSEVLFDKTKAIEGSQIIKRQESVTVNIDDERRMKLLGIESPEYRGGTVRFGNLDAIHLKILIDEGFVNLKDKQGKSPTLGEISEFMQQYPDFIVSGYAVSPQRQDCRISIDTIIGKVEVGSDAYKAFTTLFSDADEFGCNDDGLCRAWFD